MSSKTSETDKNWIPSGFVNFLRPNSQLIIDMKGGCGRLVNAHLKGGLLAYLTMLLKIGSSVGLSMDLKSG